MNAVCFFLGAMPGLINDFRPEIYKRCYKILARKHLAFEGALRSLTVWIEIFFEIGNPEVPHIKQYYSWLHKRLIPLLPALGKVSKDELVKMTLYLLLKFLYGAAFYDDRAVYLGKKGNSKVVWSYGGKNGKTRD